MTLVATKARVATVLEGVPGMGRVHNRIRTTIDGELAREYVRDDAGRVNVWEYETTSEHLHDSLDVERAEIEVDILVHFYANDEDDSRDLLDQLLHAAGLRLITVSTGFPEIKDGVRLVQKPTLVAMRTGDIAYQARLRFRLWDGNRYT